MHNLYGKGVSHNPVQSEYLSNFSLLHRTLIELVKTSKKSAWIIDNTNTSLRASMLFWVETQVAHAMLEQFFRFFQNSDVLKPKTRLFMSKANASN